MMGPMKASTIRAELRKAFKMPDADLLAWFNRQLEDLEHKPKAKKTEINTLRLLRDALVKETKRPAPPSKARRVTGRAASSKLEDIPRGMRGLLRPNNPAWPRIPDGPGSPTPWPRIPDTARSTRP